MVPKVPIALPRESWGQIIVALFESRNNEEKLALELYEALPEEEQVVLEKNAMFRNNRTRCIDQIRMIGPWEPQPAGPDYCRYCDAGEPDHNANCPWTILETIGWTE